MKFKVIIRLAISNLRSHKSRTFLTVTGVTIGVAAIIFLVSLGYGLEELVTKQVANFNAFTIIDVPASDTGELKIDQQFVDKISQTPHVSEFSLVCNIAGRIKKTESDSTAETVIISGDNNYFSMSDTSASLGELPFADNEVALNNSVINIIGEDVNTIVGREVEIETIIPDSMLNAESMKSGNGKFRMKVVGIVDYSENPVIFTNIEMLKKIGVENYSLLKVKADDSENIEQVRASIENFGYSTEYIGDTLDEINKIFNLFRIILAALGVIALVVAALGTFNTLTISLMERTKEVGLFKAIGMRNRDVYRLFLAEAIIIGIIGGVVGLALGIFLGQAINFIVSQLAESSDTQVIRLFITPINFALLVGLFSILVGFVTGWYPSRRAVKIDPLEAMRYE